MTGRRDQAQRQRLALRSLGLARRRSPGPAAGTIVSDMLPALALLAALDHAADLARLARMAADPDEDARHRRVVVIVQAAVRALAADLTSGTTEATETLYSAITSITKEDE